MGLWNWIFGKKQNDKAPGAAASEKAAAPPQSTATTAKPSDELATVVKNLRFWLIESCGVPVTHLVTEETAATSSSTLTMMTRT